MKQLIIAEKPSLAQKIIKTIGTMKQCNGYSENDKYIVTSAFGHLLTLWDLNDYLDKKDNKWELSDLNYFPEKFRYKVKNDKGVQDRYNLIKKLISRSDVDTIVNAGDSDREGEVLINIVVYNIFNELRRKKTVTRIWLEDQTDETIRRELNHQRPIENTITLYNEGRARMYEDWLYGIYLTRYISINAKKLLPTGRVIIPAVKFIYDRCYEIKNFVPEKYYKISCLIHTKNGEQITIDFPDMKYALDRKADAQRLEYELKNNPIVIKAVEQKDVTKRPKKLFSLPSLQNYMNKYFKWSLKKTLNVAQALYEHQYTTYPRTNTEYLAEPEVDKITDVIKKIIASPIYSMYQNDGIVLLPQKRIFDSSKVESHSAITITSKIPSSFSDFTEDEKTLYRVILNRCLANFCNNKCVIAETKMTFVFNGYDKEYQTSIKGQIIKEQGYLVFENDLKDKSLPKLKKGEQYYCEPAINILATKPPQNVTEDELNKFFETPFKSELSDETNDEDYKNILKGIEIGTSATRADTLEKIKKIGYIQTKKNSLVITDLGIAFINILNKLNINLWAERTAMLSAELKKVYRNELTVNAIVTQAEQEISNIISQNINIADEITNAKEEIGECPLCRRPVYENKKGYGCSGYKDGCHFFISKQIAGKNISVANAKDLLNPSKYCTRKIKGFISKNGKTFDAKLYLAEDCSIRFDFH